MNKSTSTMSRDRVHFTIPSNLLHKSTIRDCIAETLGIDNPSRLMAMARADKDLHIICRPSQFARFIILRHVKYGDQNNMACLNMRLVVPVTTAPVDDVSQNPNEAGPSGVKL